MYKHILIPTDGSDLSNKAIRHGVALAKAINAKVIGITVRIPFHVFAVDPETVTDTRDSYRKRTSAAAAKYLTQVKDAAAAAGVACAVIDALKRRRRAIDQKRCLYPALSGECEVPVTRNAKITQ
jgi:nucleotide-binding universal stress UspA family protein